PAGPSIAITTPDVGFASENQFALSLIPVAGDFDGDGKADLAILEKIGPLAADGSIVPNVTRVFVFWNIAAKTGRLDLTLGDADLVINSDSATGLVDSIAAGDVN